MGKINALLIGGPFDGKKMIVDDIPTIELRLLPTIQIYAPSSDNDEMPQVNFETHRYIKGRMFDFKSLREEDSYKECLYFYLK